MGYGFKRNSAKEESRSVAVESSLFENLCNFQNIHNGKKVQ